VVKRKLYQEQRVPHYWVVDTMARAVDVWTPDATEAHVERESLVWHPEGASAPFEFSLEELFREP
jgi:Uma2 family endonuclease